MEALVEVLGINWYGRDSELLVDRHIDEPTTNQTSDTYAIQVSGWVIGKRSPATLVELIHEGRVLRSVPVTEMRPDVAEQFPGQKAALNSGFRTSIGMLGLPLRFELTIQAALEDNTRVPLARIDIRHQAARLSFQPSIQPLMVTSWGRSGSTLLLKALLAHPEIVGHRVYPYEARLATYWMHLAKILSEPGNHLESAHPDNFAENLHWAGHLPFHSPLLTDYPALRNWVGKSYIEQVATFCAHSIEAFYSELAAVHNQQDVRYFVEKCHPIHTQTNDLLCELYGSAREIFLVRDFRDVITSMLAFNKKRGSLCFGREGTSNDEAFVDLQQAGALALLQSWRRRRNQACLLRYEELAMDPANALDQVFQYLGLNRAPDILKHCVSKAFDQSEELRGHRTSSNPAASIGRWRRDLSVGLQDCCNRAFSELLTEFGYERDAAGQ